MNSNEFNKKYNLSLGKVAPALKTFAPKGNENFGNIAGKPKKLVIEIFKRFMSNWVALLFFVLFIILLLTAIIVTSTASYSASKPISDTLKLHLVNDKTEVIGSSSFSRNLPPLYSPWVDSTNFLVGGKNYESLSSDWTTKYDGYIWKNIIAPNGDLSHSVKLVTNENGVVVRYINAYNFYKADSLAIVLAKSFEGQNLDSVSNDKLLASINQALAVNNDFKLHTYLGTSSVGIDVWTQSWVGTWQAIKLALIVAIIQTIIGVSVGVYLGFHVGTLIDTIIMRLIDIFVAPPTLIWLLLFASTFGTSDLTLGIALVFTGWVGAVGGARLFTITVRDSEFITASKSIGASKARLIYKHALPAIIGKIATRFVGSIPSIIVSVSSLAFLGFFKSDDVNLGAILSKAPAEADSNIWILLLPAAILLLISVSLHFTALGVHDALDPKVIRGK
ncbi:ABC transporter permease subunit [Mycoplasma sp. NEAQ87857]|uniref:ABC transporter permease n=1 Tax=Mycoplasma sp. NEAQ87857 TaxID=2683967 RepID=UPI0013175E16|nr:ABC transporter permease [Mycoplasma sp. NEAQ87857]QGZ97600.1 ABC transporter permease subunit [Mycoplasma sp. NEAQ87857]